jgi:hypothetical protein
LKEIEMSAGLSAGAIAGLAGAAISAGGSAYAANKNAKAAKNAANQPSAGDAAGAAGQQSWSDIMRVNDLNRQNSLWTQQQNMAAQDKNMINSSNQWGSVTRERDPTTGNLVQRSVLEGPWGDLANAGANQYGQMQGALNSGFNVNSDYMNALRAQLQPGYDAMAAAQRNRAAAMGTGFNSGAANASMEDQLGRDFNDMNQKAVLGGYDAWLKDQANSRSNMQSLMAGQQGMKGLAQQDAWANQQTPFISEPRVGQPENRTYEAAQQDFNRAQLAAANQASTGTGWGNALGGIGSALGNKDLQQAVGNWWNGAGTGDTYAPTGNGAIVGGVSQGGTGYGTYDPMAGFQNTNPWGS